MVIDDKFYVGGARDRQIIRMVRGIRRFHRVKYVPGVFVITLPCSSKQIPGCTACQGYNR